MRKIFTLFFTMALTAVAFLNVAAQRVGSLPVVLVAFSAEITSTNIIAISWTTQQQINTDCFDIEKSNDGISWQRMARVPCTGNSAKPVTYHFTDAFPIKGSNYYRICMRDRDGAFGYTITKNARVINARNTVIYPNPTSESVNILLGELPYADWNLSLVNSLGQVILQRRFSRTTTTITLPVAVYKNGYYSLDITDGHSRHSNKLMINHN